MIRCWPWTMMSATTTTTHRTTTSNVPSMMQSCVHVFVSSSVFSGRVQKSSFRNSSMMSGWGHIFIHKHYPGPDRLCVRNVFVPLCPSVWRPYRDRESERLSGGKSSKKPPLHRICGGIVVWWPKCCYADSLGTLGPGPEAHNEDEFGSASETTSSASTITINVYVWILWVWASMWRDVSMLFELYFNGSWYSRVSTRHHVYFESNSQFFCDRLTNQCSQ